MRDVVSVVFLDSFKLIENALTSEKTGIMILKSEPLFSSLITQTLPRWASIKFLVIVSPRPMPPAFLVSEFSI